MSQRDRRLNAEASDGGDRSPYQRDRDRILYSAQFRRLGGITQVTTPAEFHVFHNRLTHTLEVAQVARRMAERLLHKDPDLSAELDADVVEAAALAHDLGHPPFGHNGELTLHRIATGVGESREERTIRDGYEGNAQSLRILTKLAVREPDSIGLNLTVATLRAVIKYPWKYQENEEKLQKFGVYDADEDLFQLLWNSDNGRNQTIEAQCMDWADDIAYSTHDIFDFALAGLIPLSDLKGADRSGLRQLLGERIVEVDDDALDAVIHTFDLLPDTSPLQTSIHSSTTVGQLRQWVSHMITRYSSELVQVDDSESGLTLRKLETARQEVDVLKSITYHFAIGSAALAMRQEGERRVLRVLYDVLMDSALDPTGPSKNLLSSNARGLLATVDAPRVVLDVISGMTDAQAVAVYHKLTGHTQGSVLDGATTSMF